MCILKIYHFKKFKLFRDISDIILGQILLVKLCSNIKIQILGFPLHSLDSYHFPSCPFKFSFASYTNTTEDWGVQNNTFLTYNSRYLPTRFQVSKTLSKGTFCHICLCKGTNILAPFSSFLYYIFDICISIFSINS